MSSEKVDSKRQSRSLWKRIGYVKANGNMSQTQPHVQSNDRSHVHSGDKKHSYYNSMIQQKPAIAVSPVAHDQDNENIATDHHQTIHNDPALKDMLEQFKAMEMEEEMEYGNIRNSRNSRNPLAQSMDEVKYERHEQPQSVLYQSAHIQFGMRREEGDGQRDSAHFRKKHIYTVEEIANSANQPPTTPKQLVPENTQKLKNFCQQLIVMLRESLSKLKEGVLDDQEEINTMFGRWSMDAQEFTQTLIGKIIKRKIEKEGREREIRERKEREKEEEEGRLRREVGELKEVVRRLEEGCEEMRERNRILEKSQEQMLKTHKQQIDQLTQKQQKQLLALTQTHTQQLSQQKQRNKTFLDQLTTNNSLVFQQSIKLQAQNKSLKAKLQNVKQPPKTAPQSEQQKQQLMIKDHQISDLKKELTEQYENMQLLLSTIKDLERQSEYCKTESSELEQKNVEIERLVSRLAEVEKQLEEVTVNWETTKTNAYQLEEENFCLSQKVEGFEAETADKLREQRKLLTKESLIKVTALQQQNLKLTAQINHLTMQLKKQRSQQQQKSRNNQYLTQTNLFTQDRFLSKHTQHTLSKNPSNNQDQHRSVTSNDVNDILNSFQQQSKQQRSNYRRTTGNEPISTQTLDFRSPDRIRYTTQNYMQQNVEYNGNTPQTVQNLFSPNIRTPARNIEQIERVNLSQEELFMPFYKELGVNRKQNSKPEAGSRYPVQSIELPTRDVNKGSQLNTYPMKLKQTKSGYLHDQIDHQTLLNPVTTEPKPKKYTSNTNKYRPVQGYHHSPQRYLSTQQPVHTASKDNSYCSPMDQPNYIAKADINLNRIQEQLESLTQELKSQLAYVSRRIVR